MQHSMSERQMYENSYRRGTWSWTLQTPTTFASPINASGFYGAPIPVVQLQGMQPWDVRTWTVNLNAWLLGSGGAPSWTIAGGAAPFGLTPQQQLYSQQAARMRMEWGVDGVYETVDLDYPPGGLAFQVAAATIRLFYYQVFDSGASPADALFAPKVGGFIAPSSADAADTLVRPILTDSLSLPQTATVKTAKPPRAVAYRFALRDSVAAEVTNVTQLAGGPTTPVIKQDGTRANVVTATTAYLEAANQAMWWPLDAATQWLQFAQSGGAAGNFARIQWLLNVS